MVDTKRANRGLYRGDMREYLKESKVVWWAQKEFV